MERLSQLQPDCITSRDIEKPSLALLNDLQAEISRALNSLADRQTQGEVSYLVYMAIHINHLIAGYCELRNRGVVYASKLLIRSVIEGTFAATAALRNPTLLFKKAYSEFLEDKKLIQQEMDLLVAPPREAANRNPHLKLLEDNLINRVHDFEEFKKCFEQTHPGISTKSEKWHADQAARVADLSNLYWTYRTYSQFTHCSLGAASGDFATLTDPFDNLVMVWFAMILLEHLKKYAPVKLQNLKPFWDRADSLLV